MFKNNVYNVDKAYDYFTIKAAVIKSLEKKVKEEVLKNMTNNITGVVCYPEGAADLSLINNPLALYQLQFTKLSPNCVNQNQAMMPMLNLSLCE